MPKTPVSPNSNAGDLDVDVFREAAYFDGLTRWRLLREILSVDFIHPREIVHVLEKDCRLHDVVEVQARGLEYSGNILHDLVCFRLDVMTHDVAGGRLNRDLPAYEDHVSGADPLAIRSNGCRGVG